MATSPPSALRPPQFTAVLTGNPNCGKTTLFNALTGLRAKVGNYAGTHRGLKARPSAAWGAAPGLWQSNGQGLKARLSPAYG